MKLPKALSNKKLQKLAAKRAILHEVARDPYVDWVIIFSISLIVAIVLITIGIYAYIDMNAELNQVPANPGNATVSIDTKRLAAVLSEWQDRSSMRDDLIREYSGPSDPSN